MKGNTRNTKLQNSEQMEFIKNSFVFTDDAGKQIPTKAARNVTKLELI